MSNTNTASAMTLANVLIRYPGQSMPIADIVEVFGYAPLSQLLGINVLKINNGVAYLVMPGEG
jgi:hypothetical protein